MLNVSHIRGRRVNSAEMEDLALVDVCQNIGVLTHVSHSAANTVTGANTTLVAVTGAAFKYVTGAVYRIWGMGRVSPAAATSGCSFVLDLDGTVSEAVINLMFWHQLASTGTLTGGSSVADNTVLGSSSGVPSGPAPVPVNLCGLLTVGADDSGAAQLKFASAAAGINTLLAGFAFSVQRVA